MESTASLFPYFTLFMLFLCEQIQCTSDRRFLTGGFALGVSKGVVRDHKISEASGCAASRRHPGLLYTLNDHGGKNELYVLSTNGTLVATLDIKGSTNHDWEDLAVGPCDASNSSADCIYIGDTGDSGSSNTVYRVEEPYFLGDQDLHAQAELRFSWHEDDCETLMVDSKANLFLVTKASQGHGLFFRLPNSAWSTPKSHAKRVHISSTTHVGTVSTHKGPVGGDISPNGDEVLLKTDEAIYYWDMKGSRDYGIALALPGTTIPYTPEPQGESICWDAQGRGFYTLSEGLNQPIYYYART